MYKIFTTEGFLHLTMPEELMGSGPGFDRQEFLASEESGSESGSRRGFQHRHQHHHHHHHHYHRGEDAERFPTAFRDPGQPAEGSHPKVCTETAFLISHCVCVDVCMFPCCL